MKNDLVKLTNAVYKLLDFFPEVDPLKNRAKEKALAIMENLTLVFNDEGWVSIGEFLSQKQACLPVGREKAKLEILEDIKVLLNYLEVAKSQGWLSDVNFLIISNGYEKIKKEIGVPIIVPEKAYKEKMGSDPGLTPAAAEKENKDSQAFSFSGRQKKIVQFLENNEKAQVMDLIKVLPNITKRTIRRDLDELLKIGRIARMGEYNQVFYKINKIEIS